MNTIWFYPPGSELQKADAMGYAGPIFFLYSLPNLSCFPPKCYQILPYFTKFDKTLPNITYFTRFYQSFTKFVNHAVFFRNFDYLYFISWPYMYPQKDRVDKKQACKKSLNYHLSADYKVWHIQETSLVGTERTSNLARTLL